MIVLWSKEPTYSLLYGNLGQQDAGADRAGARHQQHSVQARRRHDHACRPTSVHDARLKLAAQGLPEGDGGFAVMSKDPGFGVSQFMEGARYQHALETELARTISNLQPVEGARVHLAVPRQSAFVRDRRPPSASVFLQMKPGRRLEYEQVTAIVNLVASSIPELEADQVTVVDQQGRLLSAPEGNDEMRRPREAARDRARHGRATTRSASSSCSRRSSARAACARRSSRRRDSRPPRRRANSIAPKARSFAASRRRRRAAATAPARRACPARSRISRRRPASRCRPAFPPPAAQAASARAQPSAPNSPPDNTSKQSTRNYEIDRTVAYTRQPAGRLKRLTVAVLVDNLRTTDDEGKVTETR